MQRIDQLDIVSQMGRGAVLPCHIPPAPAFFEAGAMVGDERSAVDIAQFLGTRMNGTDKETGNSHRDRALMAPQAVVAPREFGLGGALRLEAIQDDAQLGIERRN